jgi:hypothetical protein
MRIVSVVVILIVALSACAAIRAPSEPASCYSAQDATRYNHLYLRLESNGRYSVKLVGDVGTWGTTSGQWTTSGTTVSLQPTQADGRLTGFAPTLRKDPDGSLSLPAGSLPFRDWSPLAASGCGP